METAPNHVLEYIINDFENIKDMPLLMSEKQKKGQYVCDVCEAQIDSSFFRPFSRINYDLCQACFEKEPVDAVRITRKNDDYIV